MVREYKLKQYLQNVAKIIDSMKSIPKDVITNENYIIRIEEKEDSDLIKVEIGLNEEDFSIALGR